MLAARHGAEVDGVERAGAGSLERNAVHAQGYARQPVLVGGVEQGYERVVAAARYDRAFRRGQSSNRRRVSLGVVGHGDGGLGPVPRAVDGLYGYRRLRRLGREREGPRRVAGTGLQLQLALVGAVLVRQRRYAGRVGGPEHEREGAGRRRLAARGRWRHYFYSGRRRVVVERYRRVDGAFRDVVYPDPQRRGAVGPGRYLHGSRPGVRAGGLLEAQGLVDGVSGVAPRGYRFPGVWRHAGEAGRQRRGARRAYRPGRVSGEARRVGRDRRGP